MNEWAEPSTLGEWIIDTLSSVLILLVIVVVTFIPALILVTLRLIKGEPWPWAKGRG